MHLHVYNDPWILCHTEDGTIQTYGIRDCLLHSADIVNILIPHNNDTPWHHNSIIHMDDVSPFVLMEMILVRVCNPASEDDKLDIWERGSFNINAVDEYIRDCELRGISFDVFDQDRPFLQTPTAELQAANTKEVPVGRIQPTCPTGNAFAFYNAKETADGQALEDCYALTPAEYTASLIRNQMFRTASGSGYIPSGCVSGEPPLFIVTHGKNLFETLLLSLHVEHSAELRQNDRPMWEWDHYYESTSAMISDNRFGYLASTLNPVVYIKYGKIEDGMIRSIQLSQVRPSVPSDKPQQYHEQFLRHSTNYAVRIIDAEKKEPEHLEAVHLLTNNEPWYALASMCVDTPFNGGLFTGLEAIKFIKELRGEGLIPASQRFSCTIYGLSMVTNTYTSGAEQCKIDISIPEMLLTEQTGRKRLGELVSYLQKTARNLQRALKELDKSMHGYKGKSDDGYAFSSMCTELPDLFLVDETDRALIPGGYLDQLATDDVYGAIAEQIAANAMQTFDSISVPIQYFVDQTEIRNRLYYCIRPHSVSEKR